MSAGFTSVSSSLFLTGVFGVVKLLSAFAFMFVFVKIKGNRFWLLMGSALCGATMLILGSYTLLVISLKQIINKAFQHISSVLFHHKTNWEMPNLLSEVLFLF